MSPHALLLFLKFPTPGRVKTRLAAALGDEAAALAYRTLVSRVVANLTGLEAALRVHFDPPDSRGAIMEWITPMTAAAGLKEPDFFPQESGDLGVRLEAALGAAFAERYTKVAAIGSDCVSLTPEVVARTWKALDSHDVVLGPARDGGYYLIGTRAHQPVLFRNIPWSTPTTRSATLAAAEGARLAVAELPALSDVDTLEDWLALRLP